MSEIVNQSDVTFNALASKPPDGPYRTFDAVLVPVAVRFQIIGRLGNPVSAVLGLIQLKNMLLAAEFGSDQPPERGAVFVAGDPESPRTGDAFRMERDDNGIKFTIRDQGDTSTCTLDAPTAESFVKWLSDAVEDL